MNNSAINAQEFGDAYLDITKSEKRLVRVSVKTYENTGCYITIKLLKNIDGDFKFNQRVTLTVSEFEKLTSQASVVKNLYTFVKQRTIKVETNLETKNKDQL